jgi:hypothetical protein
MTRLKIDYRFEMDDVLKMPAIDFTREAMMSRVRAIEAAIHRFRDCGVEIERFSIQEWPGETRLCVDGVPRFTCRIVYHGDGQSIGMPHLPPTDQDC